MFNKPNSLNKVRSNRDKGTKWSRDQAKDVDKREAGKYCDSWYAGPGFYI